MSWIEPRIVYETTLLKKSVSDVGNLICLSICKDSLGKTCLLNRLRVLSNRSEFLWIPFESKRFSLRKFLVCSSNQLHHQLTELYYLMIRVLYITYQARINLTTGASRIWRRKNKDMTAVALGGKTFRDLEKRFIDTWGLHQLPHCLLFLWKNRVYHHVNKLLEARYKASLCKPKM